MLAVGCVNQARGGRNPAFRGRADRVHRQVQTTIFRADPDWPPAKEYVAVPGDLLERTAELVPYLELSFRYAQSLKPKPTKRAKQR